MKKNYRKLYEIQVIKKTYDVSDNVSLSYEKLFEGIKYVVFVPLVIGFRLFYFISELLCRLVEHKTNYLK